MHLSDRGWTAITILVVVGLVAIPASADLLSNFMSLFQTGAQAQQLDPMNLQFIGAYNDVISATSPVMNLSWNITNYNINSSYFTDCYLRVYTDMHASIYFQRQIVNPWTLNRTVNGYMLVFPNAAPQGVYYLNLQCETVNGSSTANNCGIYGNFSCSQCPYADTTCNNLTRPYESRNLDILPLFFNTTISPNSKTAMLPTAQNYMNCQRMIGVNCPVWQAEATVGGRTWNVTYGNVAPNVVS